MLKLKEEWNKIINIIHTDKNENEEEKKEQEYINTSFQCFENHYKDPRGAILKDIEYVKKGKLNPACRDLLWYLFLGILPFKKANEWKSILANSRTDYEKIKSELITKDISDFIELKRINNTNNYDEYKNILPKEEFQLLNLIKIDVDRTYQDHEIFLLDVVKKKLINVLYIFAKKNPSIGYKQGMNDICGVLLYVLHKNYYLKNNFAKDEISFAYYIFHSNNEFLEQDLYLVYTKFMSKDIAEFFKYNDIKYKQNILGRKTLEEKLSMSNEEIMNCDDSALKKRVYVLYYKKFGCIESNLYEVLVSQIEPELFLVRWYVCVFTREFSLDQVVLLWDCIIFYEFVELKLHKKNNLNTHYNFMDSIALSMLINCKKDVIKQEDDINELMNSIMHYPDSIPIEKICKKAVDIYYKLNPDISI